MKLKEKLKLISSGIKDIRNAEFREIFITSIFLAINISFQLILLGLSNVVATFGDYLV